MSESSSCGASLGIVIITDLNFVVNAIISADTLDIILGALDVLYEELEPAGISGFLGQN